MYELRYVHPASGVEAGHNAEHETMHLAAVAILGVLAELDPDGTMADHKRFAKQVADQPLGLPVTHPGSGYHFRIVPAESAIRAAGIVREYAANHRTDAKHAVWVTNPDPEWLRRNGTTAMSLGHMSPYDANYTAHRLRLIDVEATVQDEHNNIVPLVPLDDAYRVLVEEPRKRAAGRMV